MKRNQIITKFLILVLFLLSLSPALIGYSYWNVLTNDQDETINIGSWLGTPIYTAQEFYDFATKTDSTANDSYYLVNDIDFTGFTWIYDTTNFNVVFRGILDGNGYELSNLTLSLDSTSYPYFGIFPYMEGGTIKNLTLTNINLSLGSTALSSNTTSSGMLVGNISGLTNTIENITITNGGIRGTSAVGTGGLVGNISGSTTIVNIDNIKATGLRVFSTNAYAGGLVGDISTSGAQVIINDVDIQGEVSAMVFSSYSAGIIGHITSGSIFNLNRAIIEMTSQNTLETNPAYYLSYSQRFLAGIIGFNQGSSTDVVISNAFFTGALMTNESKRANYIGTAIGRDSGSSTITNSYYSMVKFTSSSGFTYTLPSRIIGTMLPVVNDSTMPTTTWWNSYSTSFLGINDLWAQDGATGRLYLIR